MKLEEGTTNGRSNASPSAAAASSPPATTATAAMLEIEFDNGSIIQHTAVGEEIARRFIAASQLPPASTRTRSRRSSRSSGSSDGGARRGARRRYRKNSVASPRKMKKPPGVGA
ncbi:MAG: KTSC domain-containing protein [Comamonadaceae bacterium]|nr:KTSC domain-containing protein [Comamonadaceae bacterium]